jgi:acetylornithine/succinyldiaminopimelate/putrescine aminotransferase
MRIRAIKALILKDIRAITTSPQMWIPMVIVPLMHKHHILTQVAGYHTEVIKFLPPLIITREDVDWFIAAMGEVLADTQRFPGAAWDTVLGLAKRAIRA